MKLRRDKHGYPSIIGITGKKGSGKDTVGQYLREHYAYRTVAYADALKRAVLIHDPLVADGLRVKHFVQILGWDGAKRAKPEIRRTLQHFGDAARFLDPDIFLAPIAGEIRWATKWDRRVAVTDVRRRNEADQIRAAGGMILRINRPGDDGDTHVSETDLDDYPVDFTIDNDGDLLTLYGRVATALDTVARGTARV